jgi:hypothetical protein
MTKRNSRRAVLHLRKLKGESRINLPSFSKARLKELIEQANKRSWMLTAKKNKQAVFSP